MIHTMKLINVLKVSPTLGISEIDVESLDIKKKYLIFFSNLAIFESQSLYLKLCLLKRA